MTRYIDFTVLYYFKAIKKPYRFVILTLQEKHAREGSQNDMVLQLREYALRAPSAGAPPLFFVLVFEILREQGYGARLRMTKTN